MEKILVKNDDNEVILNFDTNFYPYSSIISAVKDFSDCCWISINGNPDKMEIVLKPKSGEISLQFVGYEFYNYVLGIIKNSGSIKNITKTHI